MPGVGTRSRTGCFSCRRRKRRCGEQKPICLRCKRSGAACVYPEPLPAAAQNFIIAASDDHYIIPLEPDDGKTNFLHLSSDEFASFCSEYSNVTAAVKGMTYSRLSETEVRTLCHPGVLPPIRCSDKKSFEWSLIQYYAEIISNSRVYVRTNRNAFQKSIMPLILCNEGPLLSTVLALSTAEWSRNVVIGAANYRLMSAKYKGQAIRDLQMSLIQSQNAEENLLTCVLLATMEIASGSHPSWLIHLQGAVAIMRQHGQLLSPDVKSFAYTYFRFRYILLKTTQPITNHSSGPIESGRPSFRDAADPLTEFDIPLEDSIERRSSIDTHIGCSVELVDIIGQIAALPSPSCQPELSCQEIYTRGHHLEEKLLDLKFDRPNTDEYLLRSAESFRLAARIYLRLACFDTPITHYNLRELHRELLEILSNLIREGQIRRSFPMWPLFIAGCTSVTDEHRKVVLELYTIADSQWPISNIASVWQAMRTIWHSRDLETNAPILKQRDWQDVIHKHGWKLSLS